MSTAKPSTPNVQSVVGTAKVGSGSATSTDDADSVDDSILPSSDSMDDAGVELEDSDDDTSFESESVDSHREAGGATQKQKSRSSSSSKRQHTTIRVLVILAVLLIIILVSAVIAYLLYAFSNTPESANECSRTCSKPSLMKPHPPLVIISLDGYAHYYLNRKLQPSFDRIAKCGVTSERVFSSFPTVTFPNHYTMVTGEHPGHHGLVSNTIYDTEVAEKPLYLGKKLLDGFYLKEPIWSVYKKATKRKAATFSWIGSYHDSTRYLQPDYRVIYERSHTQEQRFDSIMKWLHMDEENRPGLIMAYSDEPDATGHRNLDKQLDEMLEKLDTLLGRFLDTLEEEGFLGCINLVIISDHGMSRTTNHVILEDFMDLDGLLGLYGAVAQIFRVNTTRTTEDIMDSLGCGTQDNARVFTKETMPIRYHYPKSRRVGDVVVMGVNGAVIHDEPADIRFQKSGEHGHDFIEPSIHMIMFARGPSFKEDYVLPSFQNVEYMNLWTKLLGIPMVKSDGDPWFMDLALKNFTTPQPIYSNIRKCDAWTSVEAPICSKCSTEEKDRMKQWTDCKESIVSLAVVPQEFPASEGDFCLLTGCSDMAILSTSWKNVNSGTLIEMYTSEPVSGTLSDECVFQLPKFNAACAERKLEEGFAMSTVSAYPEQALMPHDNNLIVPLKTGFKKAFLEPLNDYTRRVVQKRNRVMSISGWVYNYAYNGVYSKLQGNATHPTHIFRILIACKNEWSSKGPYCENSKDTEALSFILPHVDTDHNCLPQEKLLLQYTATVKEVEQISGQYFNLTNVPFMEQVILKLHINTKLW